MLENILIECDPVVYTNKHNIEKLARLDSFNKEDWQAYTKEFKDTNKDPDFNDNDNNYSVNVREFKKLLKKGTQTIKLKQKDYKLGRVYTNAKQSIITLPRTLSNYICGEYYNDIDIVNCHPRLMNDLVDYYVSVRKLSTGCPELKEYATDRQACLEKYNFSKNDFMTVMYYDDYKTDNPFTESINRFLTNDFYRIIKSEFIDKNEKYFEKYRKYKTKKNKDNKHPSNYNMKSSELSMVIQTIERNIAYKMDKFFEDKGFTNRCMVYDGFYIDKSFPKERKCEIEKYIKDTLGFNIILAFKETSNDKFNKFVEERYVEAQEEEDPIDRMEPSEVLQSSKYLRWKQEFEKEFFFLKKNDTICHDKYIDSKNIGIKEYTPNGLNQLYINPDFSKLMGQGIRKKKGIEPYYKYWVNDDNKRSYKDFDFLPEPSESSPDMYNLWKGFELEKVECILDDNEKKEVELAYNDFIKHVSNNDENVSKYLVNYMADIIQFPGRKPGVCLIFSADEGSGKGTFCTIIEHLIGFSNYLSTSDADEVIGRFTSSISRKLVVVLDDAVTFEIYQKNNKLKNLVTENHVKIEAKGMSSYSESSFHRVIICTNDKNPIPISNSNRRDVSIQPDIIGEELNDRIRSVINSKQKMVHLFNYLKKHKVPYNNLREWQINRPVTEAYKQMKSHSTPNPIKFLFTYLYDKEGTFTVRNDSIFANYLDFCKDNNNSPYCRNSFFSVVSKKIDGIITRVVHDKDDKNRSIKIKTLDKARIINYLTNVKNYEYIDYETKDADKVDMSEIIFLDDSGTEH